MKYPKWLTLGIITSIAWIITGAAAYFFMYSKTDLNALAWIILVLAPVIAGWIIVCCSRQADFEEGACFGLAMTILGFILPFLIGIGLIWLLGWTYGFILASIVLVLTCGLQLGLIVIVILPYLYKFLIG